jgi:hypothetical protein
MLKKFNDYIDDVFNVFLESFETKIDIHYKNNNGAIYGYFSLNNIDYLIIFRFYELSVCTVKFYRKDISLNEWTPTITDKNDSDTKQSIKVLSTIKHAVIDFIKENKPNFLIFGAMDKSKGRKNLYTYFCLDLINIFPSYEYKEFPYNGIIYILYNKDLDINIINNDLLTKIYNNEFVDTIID